MKKIHIFVCIIVIAFLSVSCIGWEKGVVESKIELGLENSPVRTKTGHIANRKNVKIEARINQTALQKWIDEYGEVMVHAAIEIENIGREKFKIDSYEFTLLSKDDEILHSEYEDSSLYSYPLFSIPRTLYPGDIGYIGGSFRIEEVTNPDDINAMKVAIDYSQTLQTRTKLPIQGAEVIPFHEDTPDEIVSVLAVNDTDNTVRELNLCVGLYDEEDTLLGIVREGPDVFRLIPHSKLLLELYRPAIPPELRSKIKAIRGACWHSSRQSF
ncbi:MAG: hypothetical protein PHX86_08080 [Caldisericia bacterium]|nr:hypothetical protein [Caldisericia bacterium]